MRYLEKINAILDGGFSKSVFDHLRNYLMCSLLLAIGVTALKKDGDQFFGLIPGHQTGMGVVFLAGILIALNFCDGVRKISKSRYHILLTVGLVFIYLFMSVRVVELAWNFRAV